jgi:hypothetical protein
MPIRVRHKQNNASTFLALFHANTSQFGPPTAGEAEGWIPSAVSIINATQAVASALGVGNARVLTFQNGSTASGSAMTLAHPDLSARGLVGATIVASASDSQLNAHIGRQVDTGSPPTENSRIAFFYIDAVDEERSWHGFGSPTFNQSVAATPEYFGIDQNRTTTTEAIARTIVPAPCTMPLVMVRYAGTVGTDHELAIMVNGVATVIGTLTGVPDEIYTYTPTVVLAALDEISFRVVRSAGSGTAMVLEALVAFVPDSP